MRVIPNSSFAVVMAVFTALVSSTVFAAQWPGGQATPVVVAEAREVLLAPTVMVSGTVMSQQQAEVPAEVAGRLTWVADVGSNIRQGQAVARMDDTLFHLQLKENQAALEREQARLKYFDRELARLDELSRSDYASKGELDKMRLDREVTVAELAVIMARLERDQETLRRYQVTAPFAGVVVEQQRREGEWVTLGDTVVTLANPDRLEVKVHVAESSVAHLGVGDEITVYRAERPFPARLNALVSVGDERSHLFELRLDVSGSDWRAGQVVRVQAPTAAAKRTLVIPRDALVLRSTGASVFRINQENSSERVSVSTGIASGSLIEVHGALQPGDKVVTRGGERLRPGQKVSMTLESPR